MAVLEGHTDQIYSMAWSQCGRFLATVCRDGRVRIYNPRSSPLPVREDGDIVAKKGARIVWALDGKYLVVTGFSRQSERQIMIYETKDLNCIHTETLDVSPGILVPFYDEDSSTLFLSGKGETTVYGYEIAEDSPHMFPLSSFKCSTPSQGLAFIPHKNAMNVRDVEFARAYRLTVNAIIPISFTVPRVKSTFFQDDIFPPTRVLWAPSSSGSAWLEGKDANPAWISLQPADMPSLSNSNGGPNKIISQTPKPNIKTNNSILTKDEAKEVGKDLTESVSKMLETSDTLEQDTMEGVDDKDWDDEN
jgi:coronin-7